MSAASSYDGALLRVVRQRVADLRSQLLELSVAYASCVPGRDDARMAELERKMAPLVCQLGHEQELLDELVAAEETSWLLLDPSEIPEPLRSRRAMSLWHRLWNARLVDGYLKPLVSRRRAALIADEMSRLLQLKQRWIFFERLWNMRNLRGDCNKAYSSPSLNAMLDPILKALPDKGRG